MSEITFITGGCRSGKSRRALELAETTGMNKTFIATCPVLDEEMNERIQRHQEERASGDWLTIEEPHCLESALEKAAKGVVVVDCLTLWVNNLMFEAEKERRILSEEDVAGRSIQVLEAAQKFSGQVLFVSNEVGLGIVPENEMARRFRDLCGRVNQCIARASDHMILMVSGQPLVVK